MSAFWQFLVDLLREVWPFRVVEGWERGVMTFWSRPWRDIPPGIWPVVPYLMDVKTASVVPAMMFGAKQDVTLEDGTPVAFSAAALVQIHDVRRAIYNVDDFKETMQEKLEAVVADELVDSTSERFNTARARRGFLTRVTNRLGTEVAEYGVTVHAVTFRNFSLGLKTYRLLTDTSSATVSW